MTFKGAVMVSGLDRRNFMRLAGGAAIGASALGAFPESATAVAGKPPVPGVNAGYLGVYATPMVAGSGNSEPKFLESMIERTFGINHSFQEKDEAPPDGRITNDIANDRIPMISWKIGPESELQDIASLTTARAQWLKDQALALKAYNTPIFMRFAWEFDLPERYSGAASTFKAAWKAAHGEFQRWGATNVAWVWAPTWRAFDTTTAASFYPGDAYVDWIAADGYSRDAFNFTSFTDIFNGPHAFADSHNKPFMVAETGVQRMSDTASGPTEQSVWLDALRAKLNTSGSFPMLRALVYYHADGDAADQKWRVTEPTNGAAFQSFKSLAWNPRLKYIHHN